MTATALRYLNLASAIAAGIAAVLWFVSAVARVKFDDTPGLDGMTPGGIVDDENNDILASQARGNWWSAWAASAAAVAAPLQATAIWFTPV
jgi:hypothetical protein